MLPAPISLANAAFWFNPLIDVFNASVISPTSSLVFASIINDLSIFPWDRFLRVSVIFTIGFVMFCAIYQTTRVSTINPIKLTISALINILFAFDVITLLGTTITNDQGVSIL